MEVGVEPPILCLDGKESPLLRHQALWLRCRGKDAGAFYIAILFSCSYRSHLSDHTFR